MLKRRDDGSGDSSGERRRRKALVDHLLELEDAGWLIITSTPSNHDVVAVELTPLGMREMNRGRVLP